MFAQIRGRQFIGHTGDLNCNQCGNLSPHGLFQNYEDEVLVFLKMGKIFSNVNAYCSICENSRYICSPATKREPAYCLKALHEHLDAGKEETKSWYLTLPPKQQDKLLERYYSLEAFDFMKFLLSKQS